MRYCRQVQKWLHLYGDGELTPRQRVTMDEHLHSCEACRTLHQQITRTLDFIRTEKEEVPLLNNPDVLTHRIMHSIQGQPDMKQEIQRQWIFWPGLPSMKLAMGCALLFLLSCLFIQEFRIMNRVSALEKKIEKPVSIRKSVFDGCLASAEELIPLFNGNAGYLIEQAKEGHIRIPSTAQYVIKFQKMSVSDQMRIMNVFQRMRDEHMDLVPRYENSKTENL